MAYPTSNDGSTYYNLNTCRSFNQPIGTSLVALSAQVCGEVFISNKTGQNVLIFDSGYSGDANGFLLANNDTITIRGVTNCSQVSAKTGTGAGLLYYRAQYYSFSIQG